MGIACAFIKLSDRSIETLLREPHRIHAFLGHEEHAPSGAGFLARLFGRRAPLPPPPSDDPLETREDENEGDVDKAWNGIHYLLTGTVDATENPLGFLVSGGAPVGDEDTGYGPARVFTSAELLAITNRLGAFDRETLFARYRPKDMDRAGVYPQIWTRDGDNGFDYLFTNFEQMRTFFIKAQKEQLGLLIFLC